jgi:hypothetical protein
MSERPEQNLRGGNDLVEGMAPFIASVAEKSTLSVWIANHPPTVFNLFARPSTRNARAASLHECNQSIWPSPFGTLCSWRSGFQFEHTD